MLDKQFALEKLTRVFVRFSGGRKKAVSLSVTTVQATNIPPKETVLYTKQTQTSSTGGVERDGRFRSLFFTKTYPQSYMLHVT